MPRKRMIDPSILSDESLGECSIQARYLFMGMVLLADDEGRLSASPKYLRKEIFGYDDLAIEGIERLVGELRANVGSLLFYEVDGREYIWFTRWERYQKIDKPYYSTLPPPPGYSSERTFRGEAPEQDRRLSAHSENVSRMIDERSADNLEHSTQERKRKEEKGKEENDGRADAPRIPKANPATVAALIDLGCLQAQAIGLAKKNPALTPEVLARWADWQHEAAVTNPVGLMVAHLKEGKTEPPKVYRNGKPANSYHAADQNLTMADIKARAAAYPENRETFE